MNNQIVDTALQSFSSALLNAVVGAMTEASGSQWLVAALPDAQAAPDESEPVLMNLMLGGSLSGACLLEFNGAEAAMLTAKCLQQPVAAFGVEQSQALLKVIEAGIEEFRSTHAPQYGPFTIDVALASEPMPDPASAIEITSADGDSNRVSIRMYLNPALAEALSLHSAAASNAAAKSDNAAAAKETKAIPEQVNLDLVMDVELNVTLRFGQRQLTLREVLELTSGSVIELDRQVEEPVELLLEGKVIARGEAVVIDGNYGLRVTEVPKPISSAVLR